MILPLPIDKMLLKNYEEDIKQISTGSSNYNTPLNSGKVSSVGSQSASLQSGRSRVIIPGAGTIRVLK